LTSALDGGEWLASCLPSWYPLDRRLYWSQSWYGYDDENKNSCHCWKSKPGFAACSLSNYRVLPVHINVKGPYLHILTMKCSVHDW